MIKAFLDEHDISYEVDVPLSRKTWIKTGGICRFFVTPSSLAEMKEVVIFLYQHNIPFDVVGCTSNCYFMREYSPEVLLSTLNVKQVSETDGSIICDCGVLISKLAKECVSKGYGGFSGLVNLPGTVAAAIYGNAGCFGCSASMMLEEISIIVPKKGSGGEFLAISKQSLNFSHRSSALKRGELKGVILTAKYRKMACDKNEEKEKAQSATYKRKLTQESPSKNLGSVYAKLIYKKNIKNIFAYTVKTVLKLLKVANGGIKAYKRIQLWQYGYTQLNKYISDKNINTFIWRDEKAEEMFVQYQEFMGKVYLTPKLEIEIRK